MGPGGIYNGKQKLEKCRKIISFKKKIQKIIYDCEYFFYKLLLIHNKNLENMKK